MVIYGKKTSTLLAVMPSQAHQFHIPIFPENDNGGFAKIAELFQLHFSNKHLCANFLRYISSLASDADIEPMSSLPRSSAIPRIVSKELYRKWIDLSLKQFELCFTLS